MFNEQCWHSAVTYLTSILTVATCALAAAFMSGVVPCALPRLASAPLSNSLHMYIHRCIVDINVRVLTVLQ
jgi:hypothetical protein